jgi:phosphatidate cytidylyltransferase
VVKVIDPGGDGVKATAASGKWGDLWQRLASGGVAAGIGLWLTWVGGVPFKLLISAIVGIMVWEVARMVGTGRLSILLGALAAGVMVALALLPTGMALPLIFLPALVGVSQLNDHRARFSLFSAAILIAGIGLFTLREDFGFIWMLWLALVVILSDVLGYFAGRVIGGPKFWPKVSPKKTWSGTIAGWIGAGLVGLVYAVKGYAGFEIISISIAIAIAGQMGDVAESALKRAVGVKDSSSIFPGHGGMFDRFDSMLGASLFLLLVEQIIEFPPVSL